MNFISEIKIRHWNAHMARAVSDPQRAEKCRRELHCWEYMAGMEKHVHAIIEHTRKTNNIPGELRYHLESLAKHVDASTAIAARITKRIGDSERGGTGRAASGLDAAAASTQVSQPSMAVCKDLNPQPS